MLAAASRGEERRREEERMDEGSDKEGGREGGRVWGGRTKRMDDGCSLATAFALRSSVLPVPLRSKGVRMEGGCRRKEG